MTNQFEIQLLCQTAVRTDSLRQRSALHLDIAGGEDAGPVHPTEQCHQVTCQEGGDTGVTRPPVKKEVIQGSPGVTCQEGGEAG